MLGFWLQAESSWVAGRPSHARSLIARALEAPALAGNGRDRAHWLALRCNALLCADRKERDASLPGQLRELIHECEREYGDGVKRQDSAQDPSSSLWIDIHTSIAYMLLVERRHPIQAVEFLDAMSIGWHLYAPTSVNKSLGRGIPSLLQQYRSGALPQAIIASAPIFRALIIYGFALLERRDIDRCLLVIGVLDASFQDIANKEKDSVSLTDMLTLRALAYLSRSVASSTWDLDEVISSINRGLVMGQDCHRIIYLKGHILYLLRQYAEATACFDECSRNLPLTYGASLMAGCCLVRDAPSTSQKDLDPAMAYLRRAITGPDTQVLAAYNIGIVFLLSNRTEQAESILIALMQDQSLISLSHRPTVARHLSQLYMERGSISSALSLIQSHLTCTCVEDARANVNILLGCQSYDAALNHIDESLVSYPDDIFLVMYKSEALFALCRYRESMIFLDQLLSSLSSLNSRENPNLGKVEPDNPPTKKARLEGHVEIPGIPLTLLNEADDINPSRSWKSILTHDSKLRIDFQARAYNNRAMCLICLGQKSEALYMLKWALFHRPGWMEAEFNLCVALWSSGNQNECAARWLTHRQIELDQPIETLQELLAINQTEVRPLSVDSQIAASVRPSQIATLTVLAIEHWISLRTDQLFVKALQDVVRERM